MKGLPANEQRDVIVRRHQRIGRFLCALLALTLTLTSPSFASDDRYAPENMPVFDYPTERDSKGYWPTLPEPWPSPVLGKGPFDLQSWEQRDYRAVVLARGLVQPRDMAFLPNADILVTEKIGRLRILHDGVLDPDPVPGTPEVISKGTMAGLMGIALHPQFASNGLIYLSYHKPVYGKYGSNAIWRGRWTGKAIEDGADIFVASDVDMEVSAIEFGSDGKLYMTIGSAAFGPPDALIRAQHGHDFAGKTIRLNDDGSVPTDNPFVGVEGMKPEIFTLGHRNQLGLAVNPATGEMWGSEQGPNGGDRIDILKPGLNYGWPLVNEGRDYLGPWMSESTRMEGMTRPHVSFNPSPALSGMTFYTGNRFPAWRNNLFVGALRFGEIPRTGHLLRIVFNDNWEEIRREMLLTDLHQRIRDVVQGPDGLLYVVTAEDDAAVLRLEPAAPQTASIIGVWKVVHIENESDTPPGRTAAAAHIRTNDDPLPSQIIFTGQHYSMVWMPGSDALQSFAKRWQPTDEEKLRRFGEVTMNTGTWTFEGGLIKAQPAVARVPEFMGGYMTYGYAWSGERLVLTLMDEYTFDGVRAPWANESSGKIHLTLARLED